MSVRLKTSGVILSLLVCTFNHIPPWWKFKPILKWADWYWLQILLSTWFKWPIIYTEGRSDEHHSPRTSSLLEAMMNRVLKDRHWKHDLLQANATLWVPFVQNYSYRDGSCNRRTRDRCTQASPRALQAFQFPRYVLISSCTSPRATVEIIHFHEEIAVSSKVFPHGSRLKVNGKGRGWPKMRPCSSAGTLCWWAFGAFYNLQIPD